MKHLYIFLFLFSCSSSNPVDQDTHVIVTFIGIPNFVIEYPKNGIQVSETITGEDSKKVIIKREIDDIVDFKVCMYKITNDVIYQYSIMVNNEWVSDFNEICFHSLNRTKRPRS